jgi:hypothetical protein
MQLIPTDLDYYHVNTSEYSGLLLSNFFIFLFYVSDKHIALLSGIQYKMEQDIDKAAK